jgi:RNA-splicing ligase RtcB
MRCARQPPAFPAGSGDIPADFRAVGQPVFIPGSMGTARGVDRVVRVVERAGLAGLVARLRPLGVVKG